MIKVIKKRSGITMMALIITIIVMVILAGTVSTLSILNIREVKSRTYKSDMAKIQKAFYDYFENTLTNSEKRETNDKLEEIRKRTITSNISGGSLQENNITIPEKNIYNARYVKVTKELMNLLDIKYTGDMQTYISLKDLNIIGSVNGSTSYNNKPLYTPRNFRYNKLDNYTLKSLLNIYFEV